MNKTDAEMVREVLEGLSKTTAFIAINSVAQGVAGGEYCCQVTRVGDWYRCDFVFNDELQDPNFKILASYIIDPSRFL